MTRVRGGGHWGLRETRVKINHYVVVGVRGGAEVGVIGLLGGGLSLLAGGTDGTTGWGVRSVSSSSSS